MGIEQISTTASENSYFAKPSLIFQYGDREIRTFEDDWGDPWFSFDDLCGVAGLASGLDALDKVRDGEKNVAIVSVDGRHEAIVVVNESGLETLNSVSGTPEADRFLKWAREAMLPEFGIASSDVGFFTVL